MMVWLEHIQTIEPSECKIDRGEFARVKTKCIEKTKIYSVTEMVVSPEKLRSKVARYLQHKDWSTFQPGVCALRSARSRHDRKI